MSDEEEWPSKYSKVFVEVMCILFSWFLGLVSVQWQRCGASLPFTLFRVLLSLITWFRPFSWQRFCVVIKGYAKIRVSIEH